MGREGDTVHGVRVMFLVVCFIDTQKSVWSNLIGHVTYLKLSCSRVIGTWESPILGVQRRLRPSVES
jgi:hypothetical protein